MAKVRKRKAKVRKRRVIIAAGPMTHEQYRRALKKLGLTVAGKATAKALGLGLRQCQRIAAGDGPVPAPVELLLRLYLIYGLPDDD
jgi:hypothetical protein